MERLISFVIPCYRSEGTIEGVVDEIRNLMKSHEKDQYEIILVNDSSPDKVWNVILELNKKYSNVKGINLAKNFGQHAALLAGYKYAAGDLIVSLDDDGQIAVEDTYKLIDELDKGYDVVYGRYKVKKHSFFRNLGTEACRLMMVHLMGVPKDFVGSSFNVMKRYVADEMEKYSNSFVFLAGLVFRATDKVTSVYVNHRSRKEGKSGYTFGKLVALWVNGATTFSIKPLRFSTIFGFIVATIGIILTVIVIINKLIHPETGAGWSSLMSVILVLCGTILIVLGVIGEYVGRIYMSSNNTPQYVIRDTIDIKKDV